MHSVPINNGGGNTNGGGGDGRKKQSPRVQQVQQAAPGLRLRMCSTMHAFTWQPFPFCGSCEAVSVFPTYVMVGDGWGVFIYADSFGKPG